MPQGIVPNPPRRPKRRTHVAPAGNSSDRLRLSSWLRRGALDEQIARGVKTESDQRLARRAAQLTSRNERDRLGRDVERMLEIAGHPAEAHSTRTGPVLSARVPLRVREIRECADDFDALVARLRSEEPIDAQGVAMTRRLLSDGGSPLYYRRGSVTLRHAVRSARLALEPVSVAAPVEVPLAA